MLLAGLAFKGYAIKAVDGAIGTVRDVLFDDRTWRTRWLVVDTGTWLTGRTVLIHPSSVVKVDVDQLSLSVKLTMAQLKDSPSADEDRPVSRQFEFNLYDYYGWDPMWGGAMMQPFGTSHLGAIAALDTVPSDAHLVDGDPHLRSIIAVTGYHVHATDGDIGHVENFLIDDQDWGIRYAVIDTSNWWLGQHVLISPHAVTAIDWPDRKVELDVSREKVFQSPPWDPAVQFDDAYAQRLHTHYAWPGKDQ